MRNYLGRVFASCCSIALVFLQSGLINGQQKLAVVVGVETYDTSVFQNLNFAEDDAEGIALALKRLGFDVSLLTSAADTTAFKPNSPQKILNAIRNKATGMSEHDTLIVTLSGHGIQFTDDELVDGVKEHYFCPEDADPNDKTSLVKFSDISAIINQCKATRKLLIVDACRNEVLSKAADKSGTALKIDLGSVFENDHTSPKGTYTLFSCSSGEKSWEHPDLQHSVFSNYVIEFLSGAATDLYDKGNLDLDGLIYYARSKTKKFVDRELGGKSQTPVLRGSSESASWNLGSLWFENSIGMRFSYIPPGEFLMGSEDELEELIKEFPGEGTGASHLASFPQHHVRISRPFYIGTHEVTIGQFRKFVDETGYQTGVERGQKRESPLPVGTFEKATSWSNSGHVKVTDAYPVTIVSWEDAQAFCKWLGSKERRIVRLPTQAEWEYACRAGSGSRFNFGDDIETLAYYANVPNRGKLHRIDITGYGANGEETVSVIVGQFAEKIVFKGGRTEAFTFESIPNEHENIMRTFVVENQSNIDMINIKTADKQFSLNRGQAVDVTPIELISPWYVNFEFFSELAEGGSDWSEYPGMPLAGQRIEFYRYEGRWAGYSQFTNPTLLSSNKLEIINTDSVNTLHVRAGQNSLTIEPNSRQSIDCVSEKMTHWISADDGYTGQLAPVGQFEPNAFGLFDMHGNVWEWCQDGFDLDYSKRQSLDPVGSKLTDMYAIRGGCYI